MRETREQRVAEPFAGTFSFFSFWIAKLIAAVVLFFALVRMEFALALAAAGALFISFAADVWSRRACSRLSCTLRPVRDRVFPGEDTGLVIELHNMKLLPVWLSLELPWIPRLAPARAYSGAPVEEGGEGEKEENEEFNRQSLLHSSLRLLSREKSRRVLSLKALRRGISRPGPVLVCAGDLLGLSSRTRSFTSGCEIIIFPRRLRLKTLNLPFQEYFGAHAARGPVEDPAWYAGTRDYTGTRPAKNIHWKASARLGSLQEKLYEPTLQRKLLFILDAADWEFCAGEETGERAGEETGEKTEGRAGENAGGSAGNFERMMETLGTLAGALMETGASFGLVTNARLEDPRAGVLPAGRGPEHLGRLLEILARVTGTSRTGLEKAIRGAARGYAGFVYCGASAGKRASRVLREISGGKKILCVFGISAIQDTPLWEGFPSCRMEDLCGDPE